MFRFTCSTANAPCKVSLSGAFLSDAAGTLGIYPRVNIQRQDYVTPGFQKYCEYGDGSFTVTTPDGFAPVAAQPGSPAPVLTAFPVHIGGSADCGGPNPASGAVPEITVPAGYYDVFSTFVFRKP